MSASSTHRRHTKTRHVCHPRLRCTMSAGPAGEDNPMQRRAFLKNAGMFALSACGESFAGLASPAAPPLRRFKLGVISDEFSQDFEEALKTMKQFGLKWV